MARLSTSKKNQKRRGANLKLRHALRAGGVITSLLLNDWFKDRKLMVCCSHNCTISTVEYSIFSSEPFALITSFTLLGMDTTNVRTVSFGILSHSSLTTTCRSATVCGEGFLESHPKILYRVEIRALGWPFQALYISPCFPGGYHISSMNWRIIVLYNCIQTLSLPLSGK